MFAFAFGLTACGGGTQEAATVSGRWYTDAQVAEGKNLFQTYCAVCHGEAAEATTDWRETDENGNYPAPPLNGSAHAWHHPLPVLEQTIAVGGVPLGGVMPGFADTLDNEDSRMTIAYFQSYWSDETYARWEEINKR